MDRKELLKLSPEDRRPILEKEVRLLLFRTAVEKWGENPQLLMCVEEMSELQVEILHLVRMRGNKTNLHEEIADVELCIEQLKDIAKCEKEVEFWKEQKLLRLSERLENGDINGLGRQ